jgi:urea transport system permease protein
MALISSDGVPGWWEPFRSGVVTILAILVLPALVAGPARPCDVPPPRPRCLLRDPLAGPGRSLRDPARRQPEGDRRSTGLNNFRGFFGFNLYDPLNKQMLFFIAAACCSRWSRWPASSW